MPDNNINIKSKEKSYNVDSLTTIYKNKNKLKNKEKISKNKPKFESDKFKKGSCGVLMKPKYKDGQRLIRKEEELRNKLASNPRMQEMIKLKGQGLKVEDAEKQSNLTQSDIRMYNRQQRKATRIAKRSVTELNEEKESDEEMDKQARFMASTKDVNKGIAWKTDSEFNLPNKSENVNILPEKKYISNNKPEKNNRVVSNKVEIKPNIISKLKLNSNEAFRLAAKDQSRIKGTGNNKYIEDSQGNRFKYVFKDSNQDNKKVIFNSDVKQPKYKYLNEIDKSGYKDKPKLQNSQFGVNFRKIK